MLGPLNTFGPLQIAFIAAFVGVVGFVIYKVFAG